MGPRTPTLNIAHSVGPTSPPETPMTSPSVNRKPVLNGRRPLNNSRNARMGSQRAFVSPRSGRPKLRPEERSPRSATSSEDEEDSSSADESSSEEEDDEEESSEDESEISGTSPHMFRAPSPPHAVRAEPPKMQTTTVVITTTFEIESLSDYDDSDYEGLEVIFPDDFEDAQSERSRSRNRPPVAELDRHMMENLENLHCSNSSSSEEDYDDEESQAQMERLKQLREQRRLRRMASGSISKRTISERGSDSDREDIRPPMETIIEFGLNQRKWRRKAGDRSSFQFMEGFPPPKIDEEIEPLSSDEENIANLAKELPYYEYMEVDSDSD